MTPRFMIVHRYIMYITQILLNQSSDVYIIRFDVTIQQNTNSDKLNLKSKFVSIYIRLYIKLHVHHYLYTYMDNQFI